MPIRVLHVVTHMNRGGLETMIMNYYRHTDRMQVQFDFLVHRSEEAAYAAEILSLGGRIYRLPPLNPFSPIYLGALNAFFAEHREYQIVHCHLDCMSGIPLKYAKKHGVSVRIAHAHSSNQTKDKKYLLKLIYKKNIVKYATHLFACGEEAGKWMFCVENSTIIKNSIHVEKYAYSAGTADAMRKSLNFSSDALVVGHLGNFTRPKNHLFILEIFAEVAARQPSAKLLLVGDGELRPAIQRKADELNITDKIIFTGVRSDVPQLLQAMDVFLFPSLYEGLPVSMIEAQAAGLPCLISDKVPIECKITDLVQQISLEAGAAHWAEAVLNAAKAPRKDTLSEIKAAGFDIQENALWLQNFYLGAMK